MNNNFSVHQISQRGNLDSNLLTRQYKFDLMARIMAIKSYDSEMKTKRKVTIELGYSISSLQRYRFDIFMLSSYRFPPNSHKRKQKSSNLEIDVERPQMTSKGLK